jgi:glycosyltransferase involved in cell wall biosynthesis
MFAPAFAPFGNPEAIVNSKLAFAFLEADWEIDIVSRKLSGNSTYDYGTEWVNPWISLRDFTHEISYDVGGFLKRAGETGLSALRLGYLIDGCRWAAKAFDVGLSLHKRNPYHVILSRCFPHSAHLPAMKMSRVTGLPWIANWNDPWEFMRQSKFQGPLRSNIGIIQSTFCKKVGRRASWNTFPSEKLRKVMSLYLGIDAMNRSSTVPHVAIPFFRKSTSEGDGRDLFRICYMGRLWKHQDPTIFLQALGIFLQQEKANDRVLFLFLGIDDFGLREKARQLGIESNIHLIGNKPYLEANKLAGKCDVLLVIDPPDVQGVLLTSKFVDYVQTGRPILAITTASSTTQSIIYANGGGIAANNSSVEDIVMALSKLYKYWNEGTLDEHYGSDRLQKLFASETIVELYLRLFENIGVSSKS